MKDFDKLITQAEADIQAARNALKNAWKPWDEKIEALKANADNAVAPLRKALQDAEARTEKLKSKKWDVEHQAIVKQVETSYPTAETFRTFCARLDKIYPEKHARHLAHEIIFWTSSIELRSPKVPGLKTLVVQESENRGDKAYGAWDEKTGKLISVMILQPSKHPGDESYAEGWINDKQIKFEKTHDSKWAGVKSPVQTWIRELRGVSNP
jgi:hypothetical protein